MEANDAAALNYLQAARHLFQETSRVEAMVAKVARCADWIKTWRDRAGKQESLENDLPKSVDLGVALSQWRTAAQSLSEVWRKVSEEDKLVLRPPMDLCKPCS